MAVEAATSLLTYAKRIKEIEPGLDLSLAEFNSEGLANDVVLFEDIVFRFPKTAHARRALGAEVAVLTHLHGRVSVPIPAPSRVEADVIVYRRLEGRTLDRLTLNRLAPSDQQRLADQLGVFLAELHEVALDANLPRTGAPTTYEVQLKRRRDAEQYVFPHLMKHQREYAESIFEILRDPTAFEFMPSLIHGDLGPYHVLVTGSELTGIIDFGTAGVGDPANDIACLLQNYGERFLERTSAAYPMLGTLLRRARFLAQALEFEWLVQGLRNQEPFWFTAHIGTARDLNQ
jgi:aminoglycoside 2''-phosphotransferase